MARTSTLERRGSGVGQEAWPLPALRRARAGVALTFLLNGAIFATWAARVPAIKQDLGLRDGQLAFAFVCLNAGAVVGLQLGPLLVSRCGSRALLRLALPAFAVTLLAVALAWDLAALSGALVAFAVANSLIDVAMNAHGVVVERGYGRPILSGLHAMYSLGGMLGAALGALAARLELATPSHFLAVAVAVAALTAAATRLLLPWWVDAARPAASRDGAPVDAAGEEAPGGGSADAAGKEPRGGGLAEAPGEEAPGGGSAAGGGGSWRSGPLAGWSRGWSGPMVVLGALGFGLMLAEGSVNDWGAVYLRDAAGSTAGVAAAGVAVFMAAMTAGRLAGDRLATWLGPVRAFRMGTILGGAGLGGALLVGTPGAGLVGLGLLGAGLSFTLPLALSAAGHLHGDRPAAVTVARVSTIGYLGSFAGPGLIGALAGPLGLPMALALPAVLVAGTALGARAVAAAGGSRGGQDRWAVPVLPTTRGGRDRLR
jgi:Major Facilitator Superfamily